MKKVILILAFVALLVTVAGPVQAAQGWFPATITYAGIITTAGDVVIIAADDSTDTYWTGDRWFIASSQTKAILATALSAWSMGAPVYLILDSDSLTDWSECYGIFTRPIQ